MNAYVAVTDPDWYSFLSGQEDVDEVNFWHGAADKQAMWERIARLRNDRPAWWEDFSIGCLMLVEPCFFPPDQWIPTPTSFSPNIVRGKGYDLTDPEGGALWDQVVTAMSTACAPSVAAETPVEQPSLFGGLAEPTTIRRRLGQGTFRILVTEAYRRSCAITGERALPALDAAPHVGS